MDVKFEMYGITLSLPWEGKGLQLGMDLRDAIYNVENSIGNTNSAWQLMRVLKLAEENSAELTMLKAKGDRVRVSLNFFSNTQLEKFCEDIKQL